MMVALLLYGYCQGERSSRVIERRCVRDVGYRIIVGGLRPEQATIARFRARHETALGGLVQSGAAAARRRGDGVAGQAEPGWHEAGRQRRADGATATLPQIERILAEAAEADVAEDAEFGDRRRPAIRATGRNGRCPMWRSRGKSGCRGRRPANA